MIPTALFAGIAIGMSLQAPDPKALGEELTRRNLEQRSYTLRYSLRADSAPADAPPSSIIDLFVDYPHGKCLINLHLSEEIEAGSLERHLFLDGFVVRSWGADMEPVQIDFEESSRAYRDSQKELIRTLLQLVPAADTSAPEFLPWLPSVRLGLSRVAPPQAFCDFLLGCGPALCGNVGSWLNTLRHFETVEVKEEGDLYLVRLPDGREIQIERKTGFLRSFRSRNADGSAFVLSLEERHLGAPFPAFRQPTAWKPGVPPPDWDRELGEWNTQILERVITVIAANPGRLTGEAERAAFLGALSRSSALCADYLERSFLRQNAREQVKKLLKSGLTASELRADAEGLSAGYIASYERGSADFQNNLWKSLDETLFLDFRMRIRGILKASGTPLEFAVHQALGRESSAAFQTHPEPEQVGRIFREELERGCRE